MAQQGSPKGFEAVAVKRREKALELRMAGMSYYYIGEKLGVNKGTAWRDVQRAIKDVQDNYSDNAKAVTTIELKRLDRMLLALWQEAAEGNQTAIDRVLKIMERKSKLLGLDAPVKQHVEMDIPEPIKFVLGDYQSEKSK